VTWDPFPDLVIATTGRPSLGRLLRALSSGGLRRVLVVDDRPEGAALDVPAEVEVLRSGGRGPAAARNVGWRAATSTWVAFLDDDVVPPPGWAEALLADLAGLPPRVVASQGRIRVPLPSDRRPTDWESSVAGLEHARWATADMAVRRAALAAVGGFDERFPRAYREDADLGLRLRARGLELVRGAREVKHPVGPAPRSVSLAKQRGNADDALMDALHGRGWRESAGAPRGRFARHAAITAAGAVALAATAVRPAAGRAPMSPRRARAHRLSRSGSRRVGRASAAPHSGSPAPAARLAAAAGAVWLTGTVELAWARIAPGPRTPAEVATMLLTSAVLPAAATVHRLRGTMRARRLVASGAGAPVADPPAAVLLDRDDTLIHDVPYNGDPELVRPKEGVRASLDRLRARGIPVAMVSNQSGIARGLISAEQVQAVTDRVIERLGPFDDVRWCPHGAEDGCDCRKPAPGLLLGAAAALGVDPLRCAMVGDIGADVEAARAAGMRAILVPTPRTRAQEVAAAPERATTFAGAVDALLGAEASAEPAERCVRAETFPEPVERCVRAGASAEPVERCVRAEASPEPAGHCVRGEASPKPSELPLRAEAVA